jgi:RNA polymerase sigma-70 factor (ECF subfamily)
MNSPDEQLMVNALRLLDPAAWVHFLKVHEPALHQVARRYGRRLGLNTHDAEDIVQDALLRAIRYIGTFQVGGTREFLVWLHTILFNETRAFALRRRRLIRSEQGFVEEQSLAQIDEDNRQFREELERLLDEVGASDAQRSDIIDIYGYERTYAEVEAETGVKAGTLRQRNSRLIGKLRNLVRTGTVDR